MTYRITNVTANQCTIELLPQNEMEKTLLTHTEEEFTFLEHYRMAVEKFIGPDTVVLGLLDSSQYPIKVTAKIEEAKGLGSH
jgi:hypothetical protein